MSNKRCRIVYIGRMRGPATKRVMIEFPEKLLDGAEQAAAHLGITRSAVIRSAVEEYLKTMQRRELERALAEGYAANAALARQISDDFSYVDSETI